MSWTTVALADVPATPWLNGGGLTRELLAWPYPLDWVARFSVAEVTQNGPFSRLPQVRRWFAVLSGGGVRLRVNGSVVELTNQSPPFEFDGGADTACELLRGPTRDFNLMLRRGSAKVQRVRGAHQAACKSGTLVAAYATAQNATLGCANESLSLGCDTLAWRILESDTLLALTGDALLMEIAP